MKLFFGRSQKYQQSEIMERVNELFKTPPCTMHDDTEVNEEEACAQGDEFVKR